MAKSLQLRYGTSSQNDAFLGEANEISYDTERKELRMHDGETLGGTVVSCPAGSTTNFFGSIIPKGWLVCDGRSVNKADYADLYNTIGDKYTDHYMYAWKDQDDKVLYTERPASTLCNGDKVYEKLDNGTYLLYDTIVNRYGLVSTGKLKREEATRTSTGGIITGFTSTTDYVIFPTSLPAITTSFEMVVKVHTPTSFSAFSTFTNIKTDKKGIILGTSTSGVVITYLSSNGTSWNVASNYNTGITLSPDTDYYIKLAWDGEEYVVSYSTDGEEYTDGTPIANTNPLFIDWTLQCIGGTSRINEPWLSTIDLDKLYIKIDGNTVIPEATLGLTTHSTSILSRYADEDDKTFNLPNSRFVVKTQMPTAENNYTWFVLYNDGWVEQGGYLSITSGSQVLTTVNLPVKMINSYYTVNQTPITTSTGSSNDRFGSVQQITTTSFNLYLWTNISATWQVSGQSSEEVSAVSIIKY